MSVKAPCLRWILHCIYLFICSRACLFILDLSIHNVLDWSSLLKGGDSDSFALFLIHKMIGDHISFLCFLKLTKFKASNVSRSLAEVYLLDARSNSLV